MGFTTLSSLIVLSEARRPDLDYEEKYVNKKDKITGQTIKDDAGKAIKVLDKVIAQLTGRESATLTRALKRYQRLLNILKRMKEAHEDVNVQMKTELEELFDAEDNVLTRVVETVSMTATLSKYVAAADKPKKTEVDYEKVIEQLSALIDDSLAPKIVEIIAANTKVTEPEDSVVKLSVKFKDADAPGQVDEGLVDTLKSWAKKLTKKWNDWCASYDKKLDKIKADAAKMGIVLESAEVEGEVLTEKKHKKHKWSAAVKTEWTPPEGFFTKSAAAIAKGLKAASKDHKQAMSRLNFYINRAGKNLSDEDKARLESVKSKLDALYAE